MIQQEHLFPCSQVLSVTVLPQSQSFGETLQTQTQPKWTVSVRGNKEAVPELRSQPSSALPYWCLQALGSRRCFSSTQPHRLCSPRKGYLGMASSGWSFETQREYWSTFKITTLSDPLLPSTNRLFVLSPFCVLPHCLFPSDSLHKPFTLFSVTVFPLLLSESCSFASCKVLVIVVSPWWIS